MIYKWLLQVHKHARCSRKLSATTSDSRAPAARAPGSSPDVQSQWLEPWQELPVPLAHLHPPKDRLRHRADRRPDCQVLSSFGPTHSLVAAHGRVWPQIPISHLSSSPPKLALDDPPMMRRVSSLREHFHRN